MNEFHFDTLVATLPEGVAHNPHAAGTAEPAQWASGFAAAIKRLESARRDVASWNRTPNNEWVLYSKSKIEGKVPLRTNSEAYVFGTSAAIDLEHIGMVLLRNVEPAPAHLRSDDTLSWFGRLRRRLSFA